MGYYPAIDKTLKKPMFFTGISEVQLVSSVAVGRISLLTAELVPKTGHIYQFTNI